MHNTSAVQRSEFYLVLQTLSSFLCKFLAGSILSLSMVEASLAQATLSCPNTPENLNYWKSIHESQTRDPAIHDDLAEQLLPCLGSPNPILRDSYAYSLFTHWLRSNQLSMAKRHDLSSQLTENLQSEEVLLRSFSALILSEVLRADALDAIHNDEERDQILDQSLAALSEETDFRGLDAELGWVHPVAHLADVLWRYALHPQLSESQSEKLVEAVYQQAVTTEFSYISNEPDRLARVLNVLIRREAFEPEVMIEWLQNFSARHNGEEWSSVFATPEGMTELHNSKNFIRALAGQLEGAEIDQEILDQLHAIRAMLNQLV